MIIFFVVLTADLWLRIPVRQLQRLWRLSTRNLCVAFLFGLEAYLGLPRKSFKGQYGSQSGRIGSASAACNAGIPVELWGQDGDWTSFLKTKKGT